MNKLRTFAFGKPVLFSIVIIFLSVSFTFIPMKAFLSPFLDSQSASYATGILKQVFASLFLIILLTRFGLMKNAGFTHPDRWKNLWIVWPLVIFTLINGWSLVDGSLVIDKSKPFLIMLFTLTYFSTGLFEEVLCRGVVLSVMLNKWGNTKKGVYLGVTVSSVLFGLTHIIKFILNRSSLLATFTQITYGTFIGVFFAACVLRNKSIWPAIILHAAFNIFGSFKEIAVGGGLRETYFTMSIETALSSILITLPILIYGLFILRKVTPPSTAVNLR